MEDKNQFAGFWKRFAAHVMDSIILTIGMAAAFLPIGFGIFMLMRALQVDATSAQTVSGIIVGLLSAPAYLAYFALFESSQWQATPGKMAMGLVVTNDAGGRIGLGRAVGRNVARVLDSFCWNLGYIICGFTARRQCLHDFVASTLVVKKDAPLRLSL